MFVTNKTGNLCGKAAKYLAPCRFWYKEAEGGRRVRLRLVREFATRMRQRGVRVGSDKSFTFVRRVTQDTACGGMRTSPQAALFVPSEYQKALLPKGRRAFWHPQRESNSQLPLRRGLLYPFNYAGIYSFI